MLPDTDGLEICRLIRARSDSPILMLTARGDPMDRVVGLEMGADDYLPKPFDFPPIALKASTSEPCSSRAARQAASLLADATSSDRSLSSKLCRRSSTATASSPAAVANFASSASRRAVRSASVASSSRTGFVDLRRSSDMDVNSLVKELENRRALQMRRDRGPHHLRERARLCCCGRSARANRASAPRPTRRFALSCCRKALPTSPWDLGIARRCLPGSCRGCDWRRRLCLAATRNQRCVTNWRA